MPPGVLRSVSWLSSGSPNWLPEHAQANAGSLAETGTLFLQAGFSFVRQEGNHRAYPRAGALRPVVIPTYDEVPVFIIRNNLKVAGLTRGEYLQLLESE